ncbi:serine/threonine-protein kinase [Micromonospora humidisoli]|uniref:non-specific serine/threonine protein kinase n=1 Tax=Micromonospora humidisoli TaxID=2807622 RepID=A0ABS2JCL1_9ACTN|nr:serine/threonine-protein kinase [Micromonospora humidisoli]MBM7083891.1 protein kinase [Micromonospora humidisoli]
MQQVVIAGRYRLLNLVGRGGMGRVWLARDEVLHREVAVKEVVPPAWLADDERDEVRLRTLREARTAARLNHPNVVRVYDVVQVEERPWIVMEYVLSRSLQTVLDTTGPVDPARAAEIGLALLSALRAAHSAGVLHRDVKPQNVLVADDGRVMLTDFGLATFDGGDGLMTRPGMVLGSPQFVAPERAADGVSSVEADLWSLGATLHAAVEGRSPYARSTAMATLAALATSPPDPAPHAGALRPVLDGLLVRDPRQRIRHDEAARRLEEVARVAPRPEPPTVVLQVPRPMGVARPTPPPVTDEPLAPRTRADLDAERDWGPPGRRITADAPERPVSPAAGGAAGLDPTGHPPAAGASPPGGAGREPAEVTSGGPGRTVVGSGDPAGYPPGPGDTDGRDGAAAGDPTGSGPGTAGPQVPGPGPGAGTPGGRGPGRAGTGAGSRRATGTGGPAGMLARLPRSARGWILAGVTLAVGATAGIGTTVAINDEEHRAAPRHTDGPASSSTPSTRPYAPPAGGPGRPGPPPGAQDLAPPPLPCLRPDPVGTKVTGRPATVDDGFRPPSGWTWYDGTGYRLAVPIGWLRTQDGQVTCFRDPGSRRTLSVEPLTGGGGGALDRLQAEERAQLGFGALPGYDKIKLAAFDGDGAQWECRWDTPFGGREHGIRLIPGRDLSGYMLSWSSADEDWDDAADELAVVRESFRGRSTELTSPT